MFNRKIYRLEVLSLIVIGGLLITQSLYAFPHFGLMMHHLPGNNHPFHDIPKIPTSENNFPELKKQLKVMHNLYKMDKTIVDVYPGPLERKLLRQRHDSQQENYSSMSS